MTEQQWLNIVAWMCDLWPHSPVEPSTASAWWPFVAHLDADNARRAVAELALEPGRRFPPGVGDIVESATPHIHRDWFDAWGEVYAAISGTTGRVRYAGDDPLVDKFLGQLGEWREQIDEANPTLRAQFRDYYRSQAANRDTEQRTAIAENVIGQLTTTDGRYLALTEGSR